MILKSKSKLNARMDKKWELYTCLHSPSLHKSSTEPRFVLDYIGVAMYYTSMENNKAYQAACEIERTEHDSKADAEEYARGPEEAGYVVTIKGPCKQHGWLTITEEKEFSELAD